MYKGGSKMIDSNVQTFVDFRGDLNHKQQPYGIVDALAFSALAYVDFEMVRSRLPLSLLEAYQFMKENTLYEGKKNLREKDYLLFESMVHQKRYQNIQLVQTKTVLNKETFRRENFLSRCTLIRKEGSKEFMRN